MKHPGCFESEDARWLLRWLRNHLIVSLAIVGVLLALRLQTRPLPRRESRAAVPGVNVAATLANPAKLSATDPTPAETQMAETQMAETQLAEAQMAETQLAEAQLAETQWAHLTPGVSTLDLAKGSVRPQGWRRTASGWENASTWRSAARPLAEIVIAQQSREPRWMNQLLGSLRRVPPLAYALLQIAAIAGIVARSRGRASTSGQPILVDPHLDRDRSAWREETSVTSGPVRGKA